MTKEERIAEFKEKWGFRGNTHPCSETLKAVLFTHTLSFVEDLIKALTEAKEIMEAE